MYSHINIIELTVRLKFLLTDPFSPPRYPASDYYGTNSKDLKGFRRSL